MRGNLRRAALACVILVALNGTVYAANFYVEYAVLIELARDFCSRYFPSDASLAQAILDKNTALGVGFMGAPAFEAELVSVRTALLADAKSLQKKWCAKTKFEIAAHGDGAMFPSEAPPANPQP